VVGVPLRPAVLAARALRPEEAKRALGLDPAKGLILVLGGSHGARPLPDVAVSRAGGVTLAELMALGVPTVAVPWPGAADDHQTANARWWAERGACRLLLEPQLDRLADEARALLEDGAARRRLARRARALSRPEALDQMRREVERCLDAQTATQTRTRTHGRRRTRPPARA